MQITQMQKKRNEDTKQTRKKAPLLVILFLVGLMAAVFLLSFTVGRYATPLSQLLQIVCGKLFGCPWTWSKPVETVLLDVRLPRVLCALLVGAALSASGATYQGVFKNPMASPDLLGASAGAGFGAAIAILTGMSAGGMTMFAFLFGIGAVLVTLLTSRFIGRGRSGVIVLVLTGMVVQSLFLAFTSMIKYVADPNNKLPAITFWLMGGLSSVTKDQVGMLLVPFIIGIIPIYLLRWRMNALSFGEEEAQAMGINVQVLRFVFLFCATLLATSSIAVAGLVGWVGLIIPHLARLLVGPDFRLLLPVSLLAGGTFLLAVDDVARTVFPVEIPLGILTAIVGAPFFLSLLLRRRRNQRS